MAYRRRNTRRKSYSRSRRSAGRGRYVSRRSRSSVAARQPTIRLVIQTTPSGSSVAVPGTIGVTQKPPGDGRAKF